MTSELEDQKQIGLWLKAARTERGFTQKQLAEIAGISRLRYHEIETGRSGTRISTLMSIARALGFELMFVPQVWVPAVNGLLRPNDVVENRSSGTLSEAGAAPDTFTFQADFEP